MRPQKVVNKLPEVVSDLVEATGTDLDYANKFSVLAAHSGEGLKVDPEPEDDISILRHATFRPHFVIKSAEGSWGLPRPSDLQMGVAALARISVYRKELSGNQERETGKLSQSLIRLAINDARNLHIPLSYEESDQDQETRYDRYKDLTRFLRVWQKPKFRMRLRAKYTN